MKKTSLLILTLCGLCLFACKKEHHATIDDNSSQSTGTRYPVSFNVSGFSQNISPINASPNRIKLAATSSADSLRQNLNLLYYLVFDSNNKLVHRLLQHAGDAGFGSVTDSLTTGKYTVFFAGSLSNELNVVNYANFSPVLLSNHYIVFNNPKFDDWGHTYFKQYDLQVGNQNQQQQLTLDRIGGQLQVNIQDAIPASVTKISIAFVYNEIYRFPGNLSFTVPNNYNNMDSITVAKHAMPYQFLNDNLPGNITADVYITAYDSRNASLYKALVPAVSVQGGKKTVLSGYLFKGSGNTGGFTVNTQPLGGTASTINF
ncbi:hypothetical protein GCM10027037_28780 [Mucilaginibacter koreensis]